MIAILKLMCFIVLVLYIVSLSSDVYFKYKRNKQLKQLKELNKQFIEHLKEMK